MMVSNMTSNDQWLADNNFITKTCIDCKTTFYTLDIDEIYCYHCIELLAQKRKHDRLHGILATIGLMSLFPVVTSTILIGVYIIGPHFGAMLGAVVALLIPTILIPAVMFVLIRDILSDLDYPN